MGKKNGTTGDNSSVHGLAEEYDVSVGLLYRLVREGELPHLRVGNRIILKRSEFEEYARRAAARHAGLDLETEAQ